jgi:DNA-binding NtrC family response regulator
MPNTIQIITASKKERLILESVFKNLGADAVFSQDLNDALAIFERTRPRAVFITEGTEPPAEIQIRELLRIAPLLPLIVLLKKRDSSRAIEYMKLGAFD